MKGHLKLLKSLDNKLNAAYASAQKSFAGRVLLKLTSEVILACLLAFAVYVATNTYHRSTAISENNQKLKHIYISISDEYITDLFGTPYITFDNNTLTNKFYILNKAILRTVVDKGNVVAFLLHLPQAKLIFRLIHLKMILEKLAIQLTIALILLILRLSQTQVLMVDITITEKFKKLADTECGTITFSALSPTVLTMIPQSICSC